MNSHFWYFRSFLTLNSNDILDEKIYYREAIWNYHFWYFRECKRIFVRQQDDIYIMLEWNQINIHLKDLLSSGYLGDAIRT